MGKYEKTLSDPIHEIEIKKTYTTIIENIQSLNLNNRRKLDELIGTNIKNLEIETKPRLIIFEVDQDKKENIHLMKLRDRLSDKRLILKYKTSN